MTRREVVRISRSVAISVGLQDKKRWPRLSVRLLSNCAEVSAAVIDLARLRDHLRHMAMRSKGGWPQRKLRLAFCSLDATLKPTMPEYPPRHWRCWRAAVEAAGMTWPEDAPRSAGCGITFRRPKHCGKDHAFRSSEPRCGCGRYVTPPGTPPSAR